MAAAKAEAAEAVEDRREVTRGVDELTMTPALKMRSLAGSLGWCWKLLLGVVPMLLLPGADGWPSVCVLAHKVGCVEISGVLLGDCDIEWRPTRLAVVAGVGPTELAGEAADLFGSTGLPALLT